MKKKCFFYCFSITLSLVAYLHFSPKEKKPKLSFSPPDANSANIIDVTDLNQKEYKYISRNELSVVFLIKDQVKRQVRYSGRPLKSIAISPSKREIAFSYEPNSESSEELSLILLKKENNEVQEIFHTYFASWDVRSNLYWLGSNHLFFVRHCGTSCQGITLLDIKTNDVKNATLSYTSFLDQPAATHFRDWFGQEFEFDNLVNEIRGEIINNKPYLIFDMVNDNGVESGQKRFLFTGESLILES